MLPYLHPTSSSLFTLTIVLVLATFLPTSFCDDDQFYVACGEQFQCGLNINNIGYPFWGQNRAVHCGLPGFSLTCESDVPLLNISSLSYRVLEIDTSSQALKVARQDLWDNFCPGSFHNTSLDFSLFNYAFGDQNITLYYDCPLAPVNQFDCPASQSNSTNMFARTDAIIVGGLNVLQCRNQVIVPVNQTMAQAINNLTASESDLRAGLTAGFGLQWTANNALCNDCIRTGGRCGYNSSTSSFACYCADQPYAETCNGSGSRSKTKLAIVLVPVVGAILASIGMGWLFFFCRQGRKKQSADLAENKDLPTSPTLSSKRLTTTNSNSATLTPSIPSYPTSTLSDFPKSNYFGVQVFTYDELERATDNFNRSKELGDGGFGTVYYGKLDDGREVAVKHLYENNFKRLEQFVNEVEILARLHHENLVKLYGCTSKRSRELLLVYEYISNGTVADHLHGKRANSVSGLLSWPVRLNIAVETAVGLAFLHESDIIHRDVKTNNILLDSNFRVKVADFGLSRLFPNDATHVSTAPQGTPGYVDPEYYQCYQLTDKSDVYSFGVVLIELISSLQAVDTNRHRHHINLANMGIEKIQNHKLHELVDKTLGFETDNTVRKMTTLVAELAFRCLQQDKDMRPTMKELVHLLRGIQNEQWNGEKAEVLDIVVDNGGAISISKDNASPPCSPDSSVTDRLVGSTPNSSG